MRIAHLLALRKGRQQVGELFAGQHARQCLQRELQAPAQLAPRKRRDGARESVEEAVVHRCVVLQQVLLDKGRGVGIHAPEQPQERRPADRGIARHLQRGHEQRAHHMLAADAVAGPARFARIEQRQAPRVERIQPPAQHGVHHDVFAAEVVVHGGQVDDGARRDLPERGGFIADLGKQLFRGVENPGLGVSCRAFAGLHGGVSLRCCLKPLSNLLRCSAPCSDGIRMLETAVRSLSTASSVSQDLNWSGHSNCATGVGNRTTMSPATCMKQACRMPAMQDIAGLRGQYLMT
ncbi:hypothetical protein D3C72_1107460 [compost metagenome]